MAVAVVAAPVALGYRIGVRNDGVVADTGDFGWLKWGGRWPILGPAPSRHTFTTVSVSPAARAFM